MKLGENTMGQTVAEYKQIHYSCKCGEEGFNEESDLMRHILSEHHCPNKEKEPEKKD